ncbi:uncharacterized protein [Parasteatoda tepidariorum]|uniref:uncharacterized protein n=1 Tax=Parasteatoda tepidariorum TaxID=114398 RepID=UPI001C71DEEA|nr:uncharacterized protein LOC107442730 [Parasteatoda tepidariorum]
MLLKMMSRLIIIFLPSVWMMHLRSNVTPLNVDVKSNTDDVQDIAQNDIPILEKILENDAHLMKSVVISHASMPDYQVIYPDNTKQENMRKKPGKEYERMIKTKKLTEAARLCISKNQDTLFQCMDNTNESYACLHPLTDEIGECGNNGAHNRPISLCIIKGQWSLVASCKNFSTDICPDLSTNFNHGKTENECFLENNNICNSNCTFGIIHKFKRPELRISTSNNSVTRFERDTEYVGNNTKRVTCIKCQLDIRLDIEEVAPGVAPKIKISVKETKLNVSQEHFDYELREN